jgi:hypothetical protein
MGLEGVGLPAMPELNLHSQLKQEIVEMRLYIEQQVGELREQIGQLRQGESRPIKIDVGEERHGGREQGKVLSLHESVDLMISRLDERCREMTSLEGPVRVGRGFDTGCHAVQGIVARLVGYLERNPAYLQAVVDNLNRPHGIEPRLRLVILHGYNEQADELVEEIETRMLSQVIDESVQNSFMHEFMASHLRSEWYEQFYTHAKAVVSCFNELLSEERPFFKEESPPYPWTLVVPPRPLTLRNCHAAFKKVQTRLLEFASCLGGIHLIEKKPGELEGIETAAYKQELLSKKRSQHLELILQTYSRDVELKFYFWED